MQVADPSENYIDSARHGQNLENAESWVNMTDRVSLTFLSAQGLETTASRVSEVLGVNLVETEGDEREASYGGQLEREDNREALR